MLRISCPACLAIINAPAKAAGHKVGCPRCGQRLQVPKPPQRTVLAKLLPAKENPPPEPEAINWWEGAAAPEIRSPATPEPAPPEIASEGVGASPSSEREGQIDPNRDHAPRIQYLDEITRKHHSGLGMASFIIALLVGGLDLMLAVVIAVGIAKSAAPPRTAFQPDGLPSRSAESVGENVKVKMAAGGMSLMCLNCMSVPLCLVGIGLGIVALVGQRDRNHLFTWIGLFGNGIVIIGVMGVYMMGAALGG